MVMSFNSISCDQALDHENVCGCLTSFWEGKYKTTRAAFLVRMRDFRKMEKEHAKNMQRVEYFKNKMGELRKCLEQIILSAEQKESSIRAYYFIPDQVMLEAKSCLGKKF